MLILFTISNFEVSSAHNMLSNTHSRESHKTLSPVNGYALIDLIEKQYLIWIKKEVEEMWTHTICMHVYFGFVLDKNKTYIS